MQLDHDSLCPVVAQFLGLDGVEAVTWETAPIPFRVLNPGTAGSAV